MFSVTDEVTGFVDLKIQVDFSIFDSPATAYGNVTGEIEVTVPPKLGAHVQLFKENGSIDAGGFSGSLQVTSITPVDGTDAVIYGLDDVVAPSRSAAAEFANRLFSELGLFVIEYGDS